MTDEMQVELHQSCFCAKGLDTQVGLLQLAPDCLGKSVLC
jgi:hypothetical protein